MLPQYTSDCSSYSNFNTLLDSTKIEDNLNEAISKLNDITKNIEEVKSVSIKSEKSTIKLIGNYFSKLITNPSKILSTFFYFVLLYFMFQTIIFENNSTANLQHLANKFTNITNIFKELEKNIINIDVNN